MGRLLEREDIAPLRIDARHDVLDRPVLAGGVHRLEDEQQRPAILRIQPILQCGERSDFSTFRLGLFGLDKLQNIERTVAAFADILARVENA